MIANFDHKELGGGPVWWKGGSGGELFLLLLFLLEDGQVEAAARAHLPLLPHLSLLPHLFVNSRRICFLLNLHIGDSKIFSLETIFGGLPYCTLL